MTRSDTQHSAASSLHLQFPLQFHPYSEFHYHPLYKTKNEKILFFRYADRFAQLEHRGMRYRRNIRLKIHEYRMGKERIKAGESWSEKKKKENTSLDTTRGNRVAKR